MMEVKFARNESVAEAIICLLRGASSSIDGALYRVNHPRLVQVLEEAVGRGLRVRLLIDGNKYNESRSTQSLLSSAIFPFRLAYGRRGLGSKMHHKFVILDRQTVLTGSYNWTVESESENHENLVILQGPQPVEAYTQEFETLWRGTGSFDA
jgi:mitochondrial cardiolipin hydrolase